MRIKPRIAALAAAIAVAGACASTPAVDEFDDATVPVVVDNSTGPISGMTVYLVPATGIRTMLGTVTGSEVDTLWYEGAEVSGLYQLVGDLPIADDIVSTSFTLTGNELVRWDVGLNSVFQYDRETMAEIRR